MGALAAAPGQRRLRQSTAGAVAPSRRDPRKSITLTVVMAAMAVYTLLPLFWLLINSTKTNAGLFSSSGLWFAHRFNLFANIGAVLTYDHHIYLWWLLDTVIYSFVGATGASLLATLGGYAFARYRFPFKKLLFSVVIAAATIPGTVLAVPTFLLYAKIHVANTPWAVIVPTLVSPFGMYLMRVYAEGAIPQEFIEAGRVDGAGELRIFRSISFRLLAPGFATVLLFQIVASWNNYFLPLIVLTSDRLFPLTVGLGAWSAEANGTTPPGLAQATYPLVLTGSLLAIIPLMGAFVLLQRYWQTGLATGGVNR